NTAGNTTVQTASAIPNGGTTQARQANQGGKRKKWSSLFSDDFFQDDPFANDPFFNDKSTRSALLPGNSASLSSPQTNYSSFAAPSGSPTPSAATSTDAPPSRMSSIGSGLGAFAMMAGSLAAGYYLNKKMSNNPNNLGYAPYGYGYAPYGYQNGYSGSPYG